FKRKEAKSVACLCGPGREYTAAYQRKAQESLVHRLFLLKLAMQKGPVHWADEPPHVDAQALSPKYDGLLEQAVRIMQDYCTLRYANLRPLVQKPRGGLGPLPDVVIRFM